MNQQDPLEAASELHRRAFLRKLAYVPPAVVALTILPSFAAYASGDNGNGGNGNNGNNGNGNR